MFDLACGFEMERFVLKKQEGQTVIEREGDSEFTTVYLDLLISKPLGKKQTNNAEFPPTVLPIFNSTTNLPDLLRDFASKVHPATSYYPQLMLP